MTSNPEELLDKTFHSLTTGMLREVKKINSGVNYETAVFLQAISESSILELLHIFHFVFLLLQQEAVTLASLLQPSIIPHTFYCTTFHKYCLQYLLHYLQKFGEWVHTNIFRRMQRNILRCMCLKKLHSGPKPLKSIIRQQTTRRHSI